MQGASVSVARGAGDTDTMKGAAKQHDPFNDLVCCQRVTWLHALRHELQQRLNLNDSERELSHDDFLQILVPNRKSQRQQQKTK